MEMGFCDSTIFSLVGAAGLQLYIIVDELLLLLNLWSQKLEALEHT
jgi:hypothetical protein